MNLFSDALLRDTVQYMSKPITLNPSTDDEYVVNGFTTNATLSPNSSYHLHTVDEFMRGDYLILSKDDYYMVTGDVIFERGAKYKATLDYCNYKNEVIEKVNDEIIGYESNGRPIWSTKDVIRGLFVGIIKHREVMISSSTGITVANTEVILTIKDTPLARDYHKVNVVLTMSDSSKWKIREVITTKTGLLELKLMSSV